MKELQNVDLPLSSGFQKIFLGFGLVFGILCIYVMVFKDTSLKDASFVILTSLGFLFFGRPGKIKLTKTELTLRSWIGTRTSYPLEDLTWVYPTDDGGAYVYFGDERIDLGTDEPGHKKFRAVFEKIAGDKLPYFGYKTSDRQSMKRKQVLGCLECHSLFPKEDVKSWTEVPKSFWQGIKTDLFYPQCPNCGEPWVFANTLDGSPVTLEGIEKLDEILWKDKNGDRNLPFGVI